MMLSSGLVAASSDVAVLLHAQYLCCRAQAIHAQARATCVLAARTRTAPRSRTAIRSAGGEGPRRRNGDAMVGLRRGRRCCRRRRRLVVAFNFVANFALAMQRIRLNKETIVVDGHCHCVSTTGWHYSSLLVVDLHSMIISLWSTRRPLGEIQTICCWWWTEVWRAAVVGCSDDNPIRFAAHQ